MTAETGEYSNEGYVEAVMTDALNWLNVVGQYDSEMPKPDTPNNRANTEVLRYLGDRMAEADLDTAELLATFERQARQARSSSEWISDAEARESARTNTFYQFARAMKRFSGRPYNNSSA